MQLHRHLAYFIHPLTPPHRHLTSLRRHLTLHLAYECLRITFQRPPSPRPLTYLNCYLTLPCCPLTLFNSPLMPPPQLLTHPLAL